MIRRIFYVVVICITAFTLTSCNTTKPLYTWHDYEDKTYEYSKRSTEELQLKLLDEYQKMIEKQKATRKTVPPGLYAEYGFLLCKTGKTQEGLSYLKEEVNLYPESNKYISRIIKQLER